MEKKEYEKFVTKEIIKCNLETLKMFKSYGLTIENAIECLENLSKG